MARAKSVQSLAPDEFAIPPDEPYADQQRELTVFLSEVQRAKDGAVKPQKLESGGRLLAAAKEDQINVLLAALNRMMWLCLRGRKCTSETDEDLKELQAYERLQNALRDLIGTLAGRTLPLTEEHVLQLLDVVVTGTKKDGEKGGVFDLMQTPIPGVLPLLVSEMETRFGQTGVPDSFRPGLEQLDATLTEWEFWAGYKKTLARVRSLLKFEKGAQAGAELPDAGEAWADGLRADVAAMKPALRGAWLKLLANVPGATLAKPTAKWKTTAEGLLKAVGAEEFARQTERWFALIGYKAQQKLGTRNGLILRALVWYASLLHGDIISRALANAVEGGCRKLPQGGLFASSIAKACIVALESMAGLEPLAQLSRLKHRVKSPWGQEEIQKALASAVERAGISPDEVDEIACPAFELGVDGKLQRKIGNYTAQLSIAGTHDVALAWRDSNGKEMEREPRDLKPHAAEVKSLKQLASDIEKMLVAQRERIERLYLSSRAWSYPVWRERYLDHPLIANQARRLIWQFTDGKRNEAAMWSGGQIVNVRGKAVDWLKPTTQVQLWHPLGVSAEGVTGWRQWLEGHQITQPFKQAHREIYILTDAEVATRTYSNRFAAHVLRQHQFKALCDARGWKYEFLGSWDSAGHTGASRELPAAKLRAHFWLNHAGDEFTQAGVSVYASTDQVRFSDEQTPARELTEIPALIFSETMRDVDLFVSVCSIGTDPAWSVNRAEAAAEPAHQAYWQDFSFGELSATARTRREVLERLLPKLGIANRCSLEKKFLVVKGSLRTYKIHLGSGNILMEPNDQYLCIVPDRSSASARAGEKVFLPFEGDGTLSIILSKAFLLAEDQKIKDETILRQVKLSNT